MDNTAETKTAQNALWAKCSACAHCWIIAYLPMEVGKAVRLAKNAACPKCGDEKPLMASESDILQVEQTNGAVSQTPEETRSDLDG